MKIDTTFDPAHNAVTIKQLAVQLNEALAPRGSPDYARIAELTNDIRLHTSGIKTWAYNNLSNQDK